MATIRASNTNAAPRFQSAIIGGTNFTWDTANTTLQDFLNAGITQQQITDLGIRPVAPTTAVSAPTTTSAPVTPTAPTTATEPPESFDPSVQTIRLADGRQFTISVIGTNITEARRMGLSFKDILEIQRRTGQLFATGGGSIIQSSELMDLQSLALDEPWLAPNVVNLLTRHANYSDEQANQFLGRTELEKSSGSKVLPRLLPGPGDLNLSTPQGLEEAVNRGIITREEANQRLFELSSRTGLPIGGEGAQAGVVPADPGSARRALFDALPPGDIFRRAQQAQFPTLTGGFAANRVFPRQQQAFQQFAPILGFGADPSQTPNEALLNAFQSFIGGAPPTGAGLGATLSNILSTAAPEAITGGFTRPGAETPFGTIQPAFQAATAPFLQGLSPFIRGGTGEVLERQFRNRVAQSPELFQTPQQVFDAFRRFIPDFEGFNQPIPGQ